MRSPEMDPAPNDLTDEQIAAQLTIEEGQLVTVFQVRILIYNALRKLRRALLDRGITPDDYF
jgi:hypothetical protein